MLACGQRHRLRESPNKTDRRTDRHRKRDRQRVEGKNSGWDGSGGGAGADQIKSLCLACPPCRPSIELVLSDPVSVWANPNRHRVRRGGLAPPGLVPSRKRHRLAMAIEHARHAEKATRPARVIPSSAPVFCFSSGATVANRTISITPCGGEQRRVVTRRYAALSNFLNQGSTVGDGSYCCWVRCRRTHVQLSKTPFRAGDHLAECPENEP